MKNLRKIIRILTIPFLLLYWLNCTLHCFLIMLLFVFDFDIEQAKDEFFIVGLISFIKDWVNNGGDAL